MQARTQDLGPKLTVILVFCSLFYLIGIDWGLPTKRAESWAHDELTPYHRGYTAMDRFHGRYPPLHYRIVNAGYWLVDQFSPTDLEPHQLNRRRQLAARLISVAMALITLVLIVATYRQLFPSAAGALLAAAIYGLSPVMVYYSKLANLEAPYLMWFTASLFFFVRILRQHRLRDYLPFALTATLAGVTKDQAIALYIVPTLVLLVSLVRFKGTNPRSWATVLFDRRILLSIVVCATAFALIHELWAPTGFRQHLAVILGPDTERFALYSRTLSGSFELLRDAVLNLVFVTGVLSFGAALLAVWWATQRRQTAWLSLLTFPVSLMIFFIFPVGYHYDRFFAISSYCRLAGGSRVWYPRVEPVPRTARLPRLVALEWIHWGEFFERDSCESSEVQ